MTEYVVYALAAVGALSLIVSFALLAYVSLSSSIWDDDEDNA